ncbi:MAG: hypothetical protein RL065_1424 [Bacteroidota bacterium]|jgi:copper chaperone CopZ
MKKIIVGLLFCLPIISNAQFKKAELKAAGLTCSMCSRAVDKQLQSLNFVDSVRVNLEEAIFTIYFNPNQIVAINDIKKKVEDAGFSVSSLKVFYQFTNQKVDENYHLNYHEMLFHFINDKPQILDGIIAFQIIGKGFLADKAWRKLESKIKKHIHPNAENSTEIKTVFHALL